MDAISKGPPVPPTPDILSSLSRRGISDLSVVVVSPRRALRHRQRRRISSRRPPLLLVLGDNHAPRKPRTSSPSSPTCLDPLRPVVEESSTSHRLFNVLETGRWARGSFIASDSRTILSVDSSTRHLDTTTLISRQAEEEFFTHRVFIPHQRAFDAYFTTPDQRRAGRSLHLTAVIFRVDGHIDRLRPQAPNSKVQPKTKPREQCRAALPRSLCKKRYYHRQDVAIASRRVTFQDLVAGRTPSVSCKRQNFRESKFPRLVWDTERSLGGIPSRLLLAVANNCALLPRERRTFGWYAASSTGLSGVRTLRENVDWTTESIGSPEREAVEWWERWWCGDQQVRQNLDRELPAGGLMRPRDDRRGREDGGGPQVEELCKRRSAKRGGRGRLAAGGGVAQVPEGGRRGWPYRGFIVCVG